MKYLLTLEEKNLVTIQALAYLTSALASPFITIFLFKNANVQVPLIYKSATLIFLLIWYVASGYLLQKFKSSTLIRFGLLNAIVLFSAFVFLKEKAVQYVILLGLIDGTVAGNFWAGYNINQFLLTFKRDRVKYFAAATRAINVLQAAAPALGGAIIMYGNRLLGNDGGYGILFATAIGLILVSLPFVSRLPHHKKITFSFTRMVKRKRTRRWKFILWQNFVLGMYDNAMGVVLGILFYVALQQELYVGVVMATSYLIGALGSTIVSRSMREDDNKYWVGAIGITLATFIFAVFPNVWGAVIFALVSGITSPFLNIALSTLYFNAVDAEEGRWQDKYHYLIERDTALGMARIISLLVLTMIVTGADEIVKIRVSLLVLSFLPLMLGLFIRKSRVLIQI